MNIPKGYTLVPAEMHLDREVIGSINFHCGDGSDNFGEHTHGLLWVGAMNDDEGKEIYGIHLLTAEYPEEGSTTLVEFAAPAPPQPIYDESKERELFEAYCEKVGLPTDTIPSGEYLIPATRFMSQGWHARGKAGKDAL